MYNIDRDVHIKKHCHDDDAPCSVFFYTKSALALLLLMWPAEHLVGVRISPFLQVFSLFDGTMGQKQGERQNMPKTHWQSIELILARNCFIIFRQLCTPKYIACCSCCSTPPVYFYDLDPAREFKNYMYEKF